MVNVLKFWTPFIFCSQLWLSELEFTKCLSNREDPDQTASSEAVWFWWACTVCLGLFDRQLFFEFLKHLVYTFYFSLFRLSFCFNTTHRWINSVLIAKWDIAFQYLMTFNEEIHNESCDYKSRLHLLSKYCNCSPSNWICRFKCQIRKKSLKS